MNNSAAKVGEIFREAGTAFSKLSEMTISLQSIEESPSGGKWTDEEVEMLRGCVNRFAVELNKISQHIKTRTMYNLRRLLEMDSGAIQDTSSFPPRPTPSQAQPPRPPSSQGQPPRPPSSQGQPARPPSSQGQPPRPPPSQAQPPRPSSSQGQPPRPPSQGQPPRPPPSQAQLPRPRPSQAQPPRPPPSQAQPPRPRPSQAQPPRPPPSQGQPPRPPPSQAQPPRPPRSQVQPTEHTQPTAEYLLPPAEYIQPQADYMPLLTEYMPLPVECMSLPRNYIVLPGGYIPPPTEYMPQLARYIPPPAECIPPPEECTPPPAMCLPSPLESVPPPAECIPSPAECIPLATEYITSPPRPSSPQLFNMYLQGFGDNNDDDDLLLSFNPEIVPPVPPEQIMQPDKIQEKSPFEFEDIQLDQINLDEIKLAIPNLLKALDESAMPSCSTNSDQNALPDLQDNCDNEFFTANIGTLHAEPTVTEGAFSSIRNETKSIHSSSPVSSAHAFALETTELYSRKRPDEAKWDIFKTDGKTELHALDSAVDTVRALNTDELHSRNRPDEAKWNIFQRKAKSESHALDSAISESRALDSAVYTARALDTGKLHSRKRPDEAKWGIFKTEAKSESHALDSAVYTARALDTAELHSRKRPDEAKWDIFKTKAKSESHALDSAVYTARALNTAEPHSRKRPDEAKWDIFKTIAKRESVKTSPTPNRQFTWFKAGETSGHDSSYTGQIKITELPSDHFKNVKGPTGSIRIDERPFKMFNVQRTETITSATIKESTETKEENKVYKPFDFFKYAQAKREEQSDNLFNFRRALEKRDQDSQSKDGDNNKEESPSHNRSEDNKTGGCFNFHQSAESRASSAVGSQGNPNSPWVVEVSDEALTPQPVKRCHTPLEVDEKATFLSIRADNKITPFKTFSRAKKAQPSGTRRSRRLSHTTAFTNYITTSAAESTSGRKRDQRPKRGKVAAEKNALGTPAKRSRKNPSGPSAKALKNKKMPKTK